MQFLHTLTRKSLPVFLAWALLFTLDRHSEEPSWYSVLPGRSPQGRCPKHKAGKRWSYGEGVRVYCDTGRLILI